MTSRTSVYKELLDEARSSAERQRFAKAIQALEHARLLPELWTSEDSLLLAECLVRVGRSEDARKLLEEILELDPSSPKAREMRDRLFDGGSSPPHIS